MAVGALSLPSFLPRSRSRTRTRSPRGSRTSFLLKLSLLKSNLRAATSGELCKRRGSELRTGTGMLPFISLWFYTRAVSGFVVLS